MNKLSKFLKSPRSKRGAASVLMIVLAVVIVIGANIGANALEDAFPNSSVDMSGNNSFRISDKTKEFLDGLEQDIKITVLLEEKTLIANGSYFNQANSLVKQIAAYSDRITMIYRDYVANKTLDAQYPDLSLSESSIFIVESSKRACVLGVSDIFNVSVDSTTYSSYITSSKVEQAIVTGILTVTSDSLAKATVITDMGDEDYTPLSSLLEENAFIVEYTNLTTADISEDSDLVLLYAPEVDIGDEELEKLRRFLSQEGHTLIYVVNYELTDTPKLDSLLEEYDISVDDGVIYENYANMVAYSNNGFMNIVSYNQELFYDSLATKSLYFVSPYTRAIVPLSNGPKVMLYSSDQAAVVPLDADENYDPTEHAGGSPVVAAAWAEKDGANLVVFGSSGAFANSVMESTMFNNGAYFMTVCNQLTDRDEFSVVIESKSMSPTALNIKYQTLVDALVIIFRWVVPLALAAVGVLVFILRRRK